MSELWQQFHFLRPWWLLALAGLGLLALPQWRRDSGQLALSRLVDAALLPVLLRGRARHRLLPLALFALGWVLATLALAGPTWNRVEQPLYVDRPAQVLAISLSRHMLARDVAPSRLDRARLKAHQLLDGNRGGLNALIGYAGEAFVVAPLTSDAHSLDDLLDAMAPDTMPVDGNDAAAAIARGVELIGEANGRGGTLVLITDAADAAAEAAARKALAAGVHVSVLGVGSAHGGPIPMPEGGFLHDDEGRMVLAARDDAALAALARAGDGAYAAMAADHSDVDAIQRVRQRGDSHASGQHGEQWQDRGPWLLLPLLLVVATAFRRGWIMLLLLACLPLLPRTAQAGTWHDLWQRPDQQAAQALREGRPEQARRLARDPAWRGVAAYRAGDYAAAADALRQVPSGDAAYNRGNALAKSRHYREAIEAYDEALKLDPANADAKANRQAVEDWLRKQSKQQKPSGASEQNKPEQNGPGQHESDQDKQDQNKSGQGKPDDGPSPSTPNGQGKSSNAPQRPGESGRTPQDGQDSPADQPEARSASQRAEQKAQAEQAQRALKQQMDQALAHGKAERRASKPPAAHQLGTLDKDDPQSKLPADLRHALQRVQDDPGGLLRRKFELEYRERHGGGATEDGQP